MRKLLLAVAVIGLTACSPTEGELKKLKGTVVISCEQYGVDMNGTFALYECLAMDSTGRLIVVKTGRHKLEPGTDFRQQKP